jgi:hypothetical protein
VATCAAWLLVGDATAFAGNPPPTPITGTVSVEFTATEALFINEVSVSEPSSLLLFNTRQSLIGARRELGQHSAGTQFVFTMVANTGAGTFTWSSDPTRNSDGQDHVRVVALGNNAYQLNWEDQPNLGDQDFNDLVMILRIGGDTDGDGLFDDWERFGIDANADGDTDDVGEKDIVAGIDQDGNGTIAANEKANPLVKDIFLELDWMACSVAGGDCATGNTHTHKPLPASIDRLVAAFRSHPSVDGGAGINLHLDVSNAVKHENVLNFNGAATGCGSVVPSTGLGDFDAVKAANFAHANVRRFAFHYALAIHFENSAAVTNPNAQLSGCGERPGNDFYIAFANPPTLAVESGTLMHELGHNLGLQHGGGDGVHLKPNYLSVMNYAFQWTGIQPSGRLDFSRRDLPDLVETNGLVEVNGIGSDPGDATTYWCPSNTERNGASNGGIDWNCSGPGFSTTPLAGSFNINHDFNGNAPVFGTLTGFNDWDKVVQSLTFQGAIGYEDGVHPETQPDELDPVTAEELHVATAGPVIADVEPHAAIRLRPSVPFTITASDLDSPCAEIKFTAEDLPAGIALANNDDCTATVSGTPTGPVGTSTATYHVTDAAGNHDARTAPYQVRWAFAGFKRPVRNPPAVNIVKPGRVIHIRFSLGGNQGFAIFAPGSPSSVPVDCRTGAPTGSPQQTFPAGRSGLRYSARRDTYRYLWKTDKRWGGTCRRLVLTLVDDTTHAATFLFLRHHHRHGDKERRR